MQKQNIYIIKSNDGNRTIDRSVLATKELAIEMFNFMDQQQQQLNLIREVEGNCNVKYFLLDEDGTKRLKEHLFINVVSMVVSL